MVEQVVRAAPEHVSNAGARIGTTGAPPRVARARRRITLAGAYAALDSARTTFLPDVAATVGQIIAAGGKSASERAARIRLSSADIADGRAPAVHGLCSVPGAEVIDNSHPTRHNSRVPQLYAALGLGVYDGAGSVLTGRPPTIPGFL
ncbi:hypothetical protein KVH15_22075 [Streptomyces olivaceus]|uniref:hypothetical protein n=1 Tax=Streptomyces olivaceus TaxID=47716 RepID=UPI001CCF201D|nr:hypothetical protein [Streptomyces olivaceus]MBZ6083696.1 hypothetical protein [Streptomyces olivaceus]